MKHILLTILFLLVAHQAQAANYWVNKASSGQNCTDSATDPGAGSSSLTIAQALACVGISAGAGAGDTVHVGAGVYVEGISNAMPSGATSFATPFTLKAEIPGTAIVRPGSGVRALYYDGGGGVSGPQYTIIDGITWDHINSGMGPGIITFSGVSDIRFQNNETMNTSTPPVKEAGGNHVYISVGIRRIEVLNNTIHDGTGWGHGAYVEGSENVIDGNHIYNINNFGMQVFNGIDGQANDNVVKNNRIHNYGLQLPTASGIALAAGTNNIAYNNLVYDGQTTGQNGAVGIATGGSTGSLIYNNVSYNNTWYPIDAGGSNATIINNVVYSTKAGSGGAAEQIFDSASATMSNNLGRLAHANIAVAGNPLFANPTNGDFRLCTAAGIPHVSCTGPSPAIDVGATLGTPYNFDAVGTQRPQGPFWDIGAMEATGIGSPMCPAPALVGQWPLDGNSTDTSGNGNNGSDGTGVTYVTGKYGQGASFAGTVAAKITIADAASLHICDGMTITAWVQPTTTPTTFETILSKLDGTGGQGPVFYSATDPVYCTNSGPAVGYLQGGDAHACHGTVLTPDVWTNVAATWNGTTFTIYKNGTPVTTASGTAVLSQNAGPLLIGGSFWDEFFTGLLDEVQMWNFAKTGGEIITIMNTPINALPPPANLLIKKFNTAVIEKSNGIVKKFGLAP